MPRKTKPTSWWRDGVFHIETPLGIVNIRPNLEDRFGRQIDSIEIMADQGIHADPKVHNVRLIKPLKKKKFEKRGGVDSYVLGN